MKIFLSLVFWQTKFTWPTKAMLVVLKKEKSAFLIAFLNSVITVKSSLIRAMKPGKKHLPISAAREGITYVFDNGQIIIFQDNFKYLGDIPFSVYFDFETIFAQKWRYMTSTILNRNTLLFLTKQPFISWKMSPLECWREKKQRP